MAIVAPVLGFTPKSHTHSIKVDLVESCSFDRALVGSSGVVVATEGVVCRPSVPVG